MEAQLLLQMRQLRGDTRAAEKRLSSSKARKHEICRDMGAELDVASQLGVVVVMNILINKGPSLRFY